MVQNRVWLFVGGNGEPFDATGAEDGGREGECASWIGAAGVAQNEPIQAPVRRGCPHPAKVEALPVASIPIFDTVATGKLPEA